MVPSEVAEKFREQFSDISSPNHYSPEFQQIRDVQITLNLESFTSEMYNSKFSTKEIKDVLSFTNSTVPGENNIIYGMISHLPEKAKQFFLKVINTIQETAFLPRSWKLSIIPIRKPRKDASQATNYLQTDCSDQLHM